MVPDLESSRGESTASKIGFWFLDDSLENFAGHRLTLAKLESVCLLCRIDQSRCGTCTRQRTLHFVVCWSDIERPSTSSTLTRGTSCRRLATAQSKSGARLRASLYER